MFDTRNLRAAALGFGLPFLLALPIADGEISIADAAQLLGSYQVEASGAVFPDDMSNTSLTLDDWPRHTLTIDDPERRTLTLDDWPRHTLEMER